MSDIPVQRSDATPEVSGDPLADAETIARDPSKQGTPEWLAAMQLIADQGRAAGPKPGFEELEREMAALRGMSEI